MPLPGKGKACLARQARLAFTLALPLGIFLLQKLLVLVLDVIVLVLTILAVSVLVLAVP